MPSSASDMPLPAAPQAASPPGPRATGELSNWAATAALAVIVALSSWGRAAVFEMPLERDEGEYAYAGWRIRLGEMPYRDFYNMKLPGMYGLYALVQVALGETPRAIHAALALAAALASVLLFVLVRRLAGNSAAVVAAAAYAACAASYRVEGTAAQSEPFIVPLILAALLLVLGPASGPRAAGAGLLLGLAVLLKQHAAVLAGGVAVVLAARLFRERSLPQGAARGGGTSQTKAGWRSLSIAAAFVGAVAAPYLALAGWLAWHGALDAFWLWTVRYAAHYAQSRALRPGLSDLAGQLARMAADQPVVAAAVGLGGAALLCDPRRRGLRLPLSAALVVSLAAISPGLHYRPHYFVLLLPALAAVAGLGGAWLAAMAARAASALPAALLVLGLSLWPVASAAALLRLNGPATLTRLTYGASPFAQAEAVAAYLAEHTEPGEAVAVLGSEPEIFYLARRRSASGFLYTYALMEDQPYARAMQAQLIREVEAADPRFVVMVEVPASWLARENSPLEIFEWWNEVRGRYEVVGVVDILSAERTEYRWGEAAAQYTPAAANRLLIYRRRS